MNTTIAILIGFGAIIGPVCIALVGTARHIGKQRHKPSRSRASRSTPMSTLLPTLRPLAFDATASEFDDVPRRRFMPVGSLSEPREGEASASAKSF